MTTAASRPHPLSQLLDLTRRLAEEFHVVPIPMVTRVVKSAAEAAQLFGDDIVSALETIERIAREDLTAIRETAGDRDAVALAG